MKNRDSGEWFADAMIIVGMVCILVTLIILWITLT